MPLKMLVAGDDLVTLKLIREVFMLHGVSVRATNDSRQAAILLNREKFDVVFTDFGMPKLGGFELVRQIRQTSWNTHTPVVIISGEGDTQTRLQAFEAGGTLFLQKPLDKSSLTHLLNTSRAIMVEERRRSKRIPFCTEVTCFIESLKIFGMSSNLSRNSIFFQADGSLKLGSVVQLSFRLEEGKPTIDVKAVVVRIDETLRVAVRFVPIQSEDLLRIRDFMARHADAF